MHCFQLLFPRFPCVFSIRQSTMCIQPPNRLLVSSLCLLAIGCAQWSQPLMSVMPHRSQHYAQELSSARLVEQSGQLLQARQRYEELLRKYPDQPESAQRLGILCQLQGDNARAIQLLKQSHQLAPENADILNDLGYALYLQGEHRQAVAALQKAQEINPADPRVGTNLAMALAVSGDVDSAYSLLRSSRKESEAAAGIGFAMSQAGQPTTAHRYFSKALSVDPDNRAAAEGLIQLSQAGSYPKGSPGEAAASARSLANANEILRGHGFVAAPQYLAGGTIVVPASAQDDIGNHTTARSASSPESESLTSIGSRLPLDSIVNARKRPAASKTGVAEFNSRSESPVVPAASMFVEQGSSLAASSRSNETLPPLQQNTHTIAAESRGLSSLETPVTTVSHSTPGEPAHLGLVAVAEATSQASSTTPTPAAPPFDHEADAAESLANSTQRRVSNGHWTPVDTIWHSAAKSSSWIPTDSQPELISTTSFSSVEPALKVPSLLPGIPWTNSTSDAELVQMQSQVQTQSQGSVRPQMPPVATPALNEASLSPQERIEMRHESSDADWKAHLIADYEALPVHKRLDLWRHPLLDSQKAVCLFPVTEGIERVEASLALDRLLGWHDFALTSLNQLVCADNSVVRQYAQQAIDERLNTLQQHSVQPSRSLPESTNRGAAD